MEPYNFSFYASIVFNEGHGLDTYDVKVEIDATDEENFKVNSLKLCKPGHITEENLLHMFKIFGFNVEEADAIKKGVSAWFEFYHEPNQDEDFDKGSSLLDDLGSALDPLN